MAEEQLNGADVGARFQKMHGKRVAQRMRGNGLGNTAAPMRLSGRRARPRWW